MSNDTFAANAAQIAILKQRVEAQDAARTARHKILKKIDAAESAAMQAIARHSVLSEGTESARRVNGIPVLRMVGSKFERTEIDPVPFSTVAIASARRTNPKFKANSQPQPPTPPQDTLAERFKAKYLATGPSDRKAIAFVVAVWLLCAVAAFGIPALIR